MLNERRRGAIGRDALFSMNLTFWGYDLARALLSGLFYPILSRLLSQESPAREWESDSPRQDETIERLLASPAHPLITA
jgi:hypothetical protein